jgi:hypothetical protein
MREVEVYTYSLLTLELGRSEWPSSPPTIPINKLCELYSQSGRSGKETDFAPLLGIDQPFPWLSSPVAWTVLPRLTVGKYFYSCFSYKFIPEFWIDTAAAKKRKVC